MNQAEQASKAEAFRALHRGPRLLLMANAWDAITARLFEAEGFAAVATTSGGVSWAIGYPDGEAAPWDEVVAQTARIAHAVSVPVTADIEAGFGETPDAVARSIADIIRAGVVGVNLEDGLRSGSPPIRSIEDVAARIGAAREAARAAGVPIVINARTDLYLKNIGDEASRLDEAVARARAYFAAGADCFYPIALRDRDTIGRLVQAVKAPININVRAGYPSVEELEALGVRRVTTATQLTLVALAAVRHVAREIKTTGRFDAIDPAIGHPEMQQLLARK
ncbi:MAG: isocitrate lyase/phosphoenolpyruvate mutase family protein [Alphaproteobacteria bacterium]|nr:isocitrate lyase/phosphoenolpyruvate mutase family protein [Alphaproteobacteria bacterium]MBV9015281.1 isocitrate lyase/phosphoenolpyruvate mutase family protein [Alphaproteobacteria bacterium]MBV9587714.1 isocitrate lyase/phosphoenolpyruvate mutase family protein [Alphaproteobacteria bacterium]MBV9967063.1 isocitrate lyase/phosphoenolpyruvate mutase family protein [Alphaproteobacteria bacterium]